MIKVPYAFLPTEQIIKGSKLFVSIARRILPAFPFLGLHLRQLGWKERAEKYLAMCLFASLLFFVLIGSVFTIFLLGLKVDKAWAAGPISAFIFTIFVFLQQILYPNMLLRKRIKSIEQNLMPALQNILIQLNSGIPIFNILNNVASSDYGKLSKEFEKAVKKINAGVSQTTALEELATNNPSNLFRRAVWQLVNGIKTGSDMGVVIEEIINGLNEQQLIQIQNYGAKLGPIAMFYMLAAVIVPSLGITFIIVLASFISLPSSTLKLIFWGLLVLIIFVQLMFLGVIKSRRPNLLVS